MKAGRSKASVSSDVTVNADVDFLTLYKLLRLAAPASGGALRKGNKDITNNEIADAAAIAIAKLASPPILNSLLTAQGDIAIRGATIPERLAKPVSGKYVRATATGYEGADLTSPLTIAETEVFDATCPDAWTDLDLSGVVGAKSAIVILKVDATGASTAEKFMFRLNGDTADYLPAGGISGKEDCGAAKMGVYIVHSDSGGIVEWLGWNAVACHVYVEAYIV